jgi:hypothetical protein
VLVDRLDHTDPDALKRLNAELLAEPPSERQVRRTAQRRRLTAIARMGGEVIAS